MGDDYTRLPAGLPVPEDDGAAAHLPGRALPALSLPSTLGDDLNLAELAEGLLVAYVYPRTGTPGEPSPQGWDDIPGARGCTPQSCAYRDALAGFERLGASLVGISAQARGRAAERGSCGRAKLGPFSDPLSTPHPRERRSNGMSESPKSSPRSQVHPSESRARLGRLRSDGPRTKTSPAGSSDRSRRNPAPATPAEPGRWR